MNRPLVSVVMPVYNAEKYLQSTIDSIINQDYPNLEIIVINDGSTDDSKKIILHNKEPRIKYFENTENSGIVKTRNRGLDEAKGEYIAVMDSDDIAFPERIKKQVDFLEKNPEYGMCGTYFQTIDGNDKLLKNVHFPSNDRDARSYLIVKNCFCHSTVMMRSKLAKELKYDTGYDVVEDYQLWYKLSRVSKIINLPVYTTYYRVHGNNISTTRNNHMFDMVNIINSQILDGLNINYSVEELNIHSNSLISNKSFFEEKQKLAELENWVLKLLSEIKKNKNNYNEFIVYKILAKKWIVLCNNTGNRKKIFFNKLISKHPFAYLGIIYKKIRENI
ncbi:MAG TPA: glycosyltransferase family 2 protein [Chitinophagaceae bacterium]|jgi:glycosyltransferase involved in cell wall biosynthesis|nr:glycosyltransferase family 2 protein [Chitinophagaceae bacterium]